MENIQLHNKLAMESISSDLINIEDKYRSNMFNWRGQFSPQLIESLLIHYASEGNVVFDPFLGSGTTLLESSRLGLEAYGCEINPAAHIFSKIYELINIDPAQRDISIIFIDTFITRYIGNSVKDNKTEHEKFIHDLLLLKNDADFVVNNIISALIISLNLEITKFSYDKCFKIWNNLKQNIKSLPFTSIPVKGFHCDARKSPLSNNSIDIVITSPPYINVFNYHQNYRKSVEKLGWDVLEIAKSEIGANRKFRGNRFITVVQYCMDLAEVYLELSRVCKSTAKIIFIVGKESKVRKTPFYNADLLISVAEAIGFKKVGQQQRSFKNKFGQEIFEEVLRFECKETIIKHTDAVEIARQIGINGLIKAKTYADNEFLSDITEAIEKAKSISVSPITKHKGV